MTAKCSCEHCGVNIEFDVASANQLVTCPSCGQEIRLLMPRTNEHAARAQAARILAKPAPAGIGPILPSDGNGLIFKNGRVTVTPTLLTVGLTNFPISAISSFRVVAIPPCERNITRLSLCAVLVLLLGIFSLLANAADSGNSPGGQVLGWTLICIAVLILAVAIFAKAVPTFGYKLTGKPCFGLNITTSAGEKTAITSPEIETVDAIGDALRSAISKRG